MMSEFGGIECVEKLNECNYDYWKMCMEAYLQGQDLWEIIGGDEITPPTEENVEALHKWKIKAGKAMFVLRMTVQKELLEYIREATTPKEVWDTFVALFSKTNDARLQFLENELAAVMQGSMSISKYFLKVKSLCNEISQLDQESKISESRMRRIITRGLRPEYSGLMTAIRGWSTQPTLMELESLLVNQEILVKQMFGAKIKSNEEDALFCSGSRWQSSMKQENVEDEKSMCNRSYLAGGALFSSSQRDQKTSGYVILGFDESEEEWDFESPSAVFTATEVVMEEESYNETTACTSIVEARESLFAGEGKIGELDHMVKGVTENGQEEMSINNPAQQQEKLGELIELSNLLDEKLDHNLSKGQEEYVGARQVKETHFAGWEKYGNDGSKTQSIVFMEGHSEWKKILQGDEVESVLRGSVESHHRLCRSLRMFPECSRSL